MPDTPANTSAVALRSPIARACMEYLFQRHIPAVVAAPDALPMAMDRRLGVGRHASDPK